MTQTRALDPGMNAGVWARSHPGVPSPLAPLLGQREEVICE